MPKRSIVLISLLLFVLLATCLVRGNRTFLFQQEVHEISDFALNALQIERAKHFQELYGNYSRFYFNHPGPAFFYVYALGEYVWFDQLGLVPSPYNAHVLTGILLQAGFFVLALLLLSDLLGRRRVVPLALVIGAFHFGAAGHVFASIWPPEVLVMPFLAFIVTCAGIATGRLHWLPWLVLSGSFLVHGHVVQPLFVVTLAVAAYIAALRTTASPTPRGFSRIRQSATAHLVAIALLLVFLAPLVIDLFAEPPSNAALILRHREMNVSGDKSLVQSLLFFLSFVAYTDKPELVLDAGVDAGAFAIFSSRPVIFLLWLAALASVVVAFWRNRTGAAIGLGGRPGFRALVGFWFATVALAAYWGLLVTGPMFAYNGHFYHGLHFLVYVLAATLLAERWSKVLVAVGAALAVTAAAWGYANRIKHEPGFADARGLQLRNATQAALTIDPAPDVPALLVFERDDWSIAASVALALRRADREFRAGPVWRFMFQERYVLRPEKTAASDFPYSVWRFVRLPRVEPAVPLTGPLHLVFDAPELSPVAGRIRFDRDGDFTHYNLVGINTPDGREGAWTNYPHALLQFRPGPATEAVHLQVVAVPYLVADRIELQPTELWFNEHRVFSAPFTGPGVLRADIPPEIWNEKPMAFLRLHVPNANAPAELGVSGDPRHLALSLEEITTRPVSAVPR